MAHANDTRDIEAETIALGQHPIAGGAPDVTVDDPPVGDPPPANDPPADDPPPPTAAELLEQERLRAARLEGEIAALKAQPKAEPVRAAQKVYTPEEVEQLFADQRITDTQRIAYYSDRNYDARRAQEREQAARERPEWLADEKLGEYLKDYPDLNDATSELIAKVKEELLFQRQLGKNPESKVTQLDAVRAVVGGHRLGGREVDTREFDRRRQLGTGGGAPGGGGGGGGKPDPLKGIHPLQIDHWTKMGYTKAQMIAEAPYVRRTPRRGAA